MIDPDSNESAAMHYAITPLAEYITSIDMHRPLTAYSRKEILTMIEVIVTAYQEHSQEEVTHAGL